MNSNTPPHNLCNWIHTQIFFSGNKKVWLIWKNYVPYLCSQMQIHFHGWNFEHIYLKFQFFFVCNINCILCYRKFYYLPLKKHKCQLKIGYITFSKRFLWDKCFCSDFIFSYFPYLFTSIIRKSVRSYTFLQFSN